MNQFDENDFEIDTILGKDKRENLNKIAIYLDYALNKTILRQIPDITPNDEKYYAKKILINYINGDMHSFTSKANIRNNIYKIGINNLIKLFLKTMIEKQAYNVLIKKINGSDNYRDQCANYITNRIRKNHYNDILEWLNSDNENIEEIISNYIDMTYKKSLSDHFNLEALTTKNYETNKAMEILYLQ